MYILYDLIDVLTSYLSGFSEIQLTWKLESYGVLLSSSFRWWFVVVEQKHPHNIWSGFILEPLEGFEFRNIILYISYLEMLNPINSLNRELGINTGKFDLNFTCLLLLYAGAYIKGQVSVLLCLLWASFWRNDLNKWFCCS